MSKFDRLKNLLMIVAALAALGAPVAARADLSFADITLGATGTLDLGIFVVGPTTMNASNSGTLFDTNIGLANGSSTNFSGGGTLTGNFYKDPGATIQSNIASQFNYGGIVTQSLSGAVSDVQTAASNAKLLTPDQTFGALGSSATTINSSTSLTNSLGGYDTVVNVGSISITNPSNNLTINGGTNDFFIINVTSGNVSVTNGQIALSGGITFDHVLFNIWPTADVALSNASSILNGTFLAPFAGQKITLSPGTVNGGIIAYEISTSSGPNVNGGLFTSPVPEPEIYAMLGVGLGLMGWVGRRRKLQAA